MEFVLILLADREAPEDPSIYPEMGRFAGELAGSGKLRGGAPLHPEAKGARVTGAVVRDGPFPSRVVIGGYFLIECNRAEAIGILGRHTKMERKLLDAVYDEYFVNAKIYAKRGEIELAGLDLALADMARDGAIIKPPAPPATKYVLARDMGGLVA